MKMVFSGASDDLIYYTDDTEDPPRNDVNGAPLDEASFLKYGGWIVTVPSGEHFRVFAHYQTNGTWSLSISMMDEGAVFPGPIASTVFFEHSYSVALEVEVPDGSFAVLDETGKHS